MKFLFELALTPLSSKFILPRSVDPPAMFLTIHPSPLILLSILVYHFTLTISFPFHIIALIHTSVGPFILPESVLLVIQPLPFVPLPVFQLQNPETVHLIVLEMTVKYLSLLSKDSFAVSFVIQKLSVVSTTVWILCLSLTVWKVVLPLTLVLVPVDIEVLSMSVCYVIFEIPFIVTSIRLDPSPSSFASSVPEFALQKVPIVKIQFTVSIGFVFVHLADVFGIKVSHVFLLIVLGVVVCRLETGEVVKSGKNCVAFDFGFVDSGDVADSALK